MGEGWIRIRTLVGFSLWIFDFVTDILNVIEYWRHQSITISILATVFLGLSTLVGFIIIILAVFTVLTGDKNLARYLTGMKCVETVVESVPQLIINLYILSSCGQDLPTAQNFLTTVSSTEIPTITNGWSLVLFTEAENVTTIQNVTTAGPSTSNFTMSDNVTATKYNIPVIQYISLAGSFLGMCAGIISFDKLAIKKDKFEEKKLDLLETIFLFVTKAFALLSRILILVYFIFYLGWYTAVFVVIHILIIVTPAVVLSRGDDDKSIVIAAAVSAFTWFQFVWAFDAFFGKWATLGFSIFYSVENLILLAISLNLKLYSDPFCLYSNVLGVNVGLNVGCLVFAIIYICLRARRRQLPAEH